MDHDLVLRRLLEVEDDREFGGLDDDGLGGILGLLAGLGDDDRHGVARRSGSCPSSSGQCVGTLMSSVIGQTIGRLEGNASSRSAAVSTAITPGIDAAADVSIRSIRACTYGGRTISIHAIPAIVWLSTKVPWPVSSLASSLRRTDDPT